MLDIFLVFTSHILCVDLLLPDYVSPENLFISNPLYLFCLYLLISYLYPIHIPVYLIVSYCILQGPLPPYYPVT